MDYILSGEKNDLETGAREIIPSDPNSPLNEKKQKSVEKTVLKMGEDRNRKYENRKNADRKRGIKD